MRALPFIVLTAALLGFATYQNGTTAQTTSLVATADLPPQDAKPKPETKPTPGTETKKSGDAKAGSVDDEVKALALKPMNLGRAMKQFEQFKTDKKIEDWAKNGATDFADVRKQAVSITATAKAIDWKKNKRRAKDAAAFDQIASDFESSAHSLAEAAGKKDAEQVKAAAAKLGQACSDCHHKFK